MNHLNTSHTINSKSWSAVLYFFCQEMNEIYSAFYLDFSKEIFKGNVSFLMSPRAAKPCASSYGLSETGQTEVGVNKTT